jgi:hypothetical protein
VSRYLSGINVFGEPVKEAMLDKNNSGQVTLNRRDFVIGLGASALMVISGCATSRNSSEMDTAFADLEVLLNQSSGSNTEQLASITRRIRDQSREFLSTNQTFITVFNSQASSRSVTMEELQKLVGNYEVERQALRNKLLHLQDELHAALPADAWREVLDVLNRKAGAITAINISET